MNTSTRTTPAPRPAGKRRYARAVLLAGALTLAANVLGQIATASAEWDIEKYDRCMYVPGIKPAYCCIDSGGRLDPNTGVCTAPWVGVASASPIFQPTKQPGTIMGGAENTVTGNRSG
jgi:hypothetical protein